MILVKYTMRMKTRTCDDKGYFLPYIHKTKINIKNNKEKLLRITIFILQSVTIVSNYVKNQHISYILIENTFSTSCVV